MIAAILAAEIAFWVFLAGGLLLRYVVRAHRLSTLALAAVPLVDLALLVFVTIDVAGGAEATRPHALATVYLGFTVAFGHRTIRWADRWFRYRFADGPRPVRAAKGARALWSEWARVVLAAAIAAACLALMIAVEGHGLPGSADEAFRHPYWSTMLQLGMIVVIWFLAGPAFAGPGGEPMVRERPGTGHR